MQESEFTGCVNKVQGKPAIRRENHRKSWAFRVIAKKQSGHCIDALRRFLYDELRKGA